MSWNESLASLCLGFPICAHVSLTVSFLCRMLLRINRTRRGPERTLPAVRAHELSAAVVTQEVMGVTSASPLLVWPTGSSGLDLQMTRGCPGSSV